MKIGFIGAGNMGGAIARNLIRHKHEVFVFDLNKEAVKNVIAVGETGKAAESFKDFADCDIVFSCLPMPAHVLGVSLGEEGVHRAMKKGAVHIEISTIDPQTTTKAREDAEALGLGYIQCGIGKGPAFAEKGEQIFFVGGRDEVVEPLWEPFLKQISIPYRLPRAEDASTIKIISNMMAGSIVTVIAECIKMAEALGMDPNTMVELCKVTGCNSFHLGVSGPLMANKDFKSRFALDLSRKDVRLGCEMARAKGLNLQVVENVLSLFNKAHDLGLGNEDSCAIYKVVGN